MPSQTSRLHQLTIGMDFLTSDSLHPIAFSLTSAINQVISGHILVFSRIFIDLDACLLLIGAPVCLTTLSATRTSTSRTGLIQAINYQHSDGGVHFYALDIVSPDWQLTQSVHTRSFTGQSTLDIVTAVLSDYDFDWQASEMLLSSAAIQQPLAMRTQSDVSDWDFVMALLADIGVSALWIAGDSIDNLGYLAVISELDQLELLSLDYTYAQSSVQSGQDTVNELQIVAKQLGSRSVMVRADGLAADTIFEGQAHDESPLAIDDTTVLLASPSRVNSDAAATQLAEQWVLANSSHRETYQATGAMRGLSAGAPVSINDLPSIGSLLAHCLSVHIIGIEPDSDSVSYQHQTMIKDWLIHTTQHEHISNTLPHHAYEIARQTGVWVSAKLLDVAISYCPYPSKQSFASSHYHGLTQARTGTNASPSYDSQITDDNLQQTITTPVWAGVSSGSSDNTTPPLRSLQLSSGAAHGWQFAPREGQSVLLTHWYGDIDSPVISRSLYDGIGMGDVDDKDITVGASEAAHRHNTKGGSSPRWHGGGLGHSQISEDDEHSGWLSGIAQYGLNSSSEVSLSFDDTPNKIGLQWVVNGGQRANAESPTLAELATFAPSEHMIELGVLRHRFSNHQSNNSGHGFRVATDNSLQVTGNQGVLLSTFGIRHTQADHESAWVNDAGQRQLGLGAELSTTFSEAKQAHLQSTQDVDESLKAFKSTAQVMDESLNTEILGASDVILVSKDSTLASGSNTLWTAKTIVRQSGNTQSDMVAGNYSLAANEIESLAGVGGQAEQSGLHMSANREPLGIQAQGGELRLNSQQGMTIGSESGEVNISSPKRIKLQTSGGASITIDDSGIKLVCPGEIKVQAVKKSLVAGGRVNAPMIALPTSGLFSKAFDLKKLLPQDLIDQGISYKLINHSKGTEFEGQLDEDGQTLRVFGDRAEKVELELIGNVNHKGEIKAIDVSNQIKSDHCSIEDLFEDCGDNHAHDEDDFGC